MPVAGLTSSQHAVPKRSRGPVDLRSPPKPRTDALRGAVSDGRARREHARRWSWQAGAGVGASCWPALTSRHIEALAIDVSISWAGDLTLLLPGATQRTITTPPRTGMNAALKEVGQGYGVVKSRRGAHDPPHWSSDGY